MAEKISTQLLSIIKELIKLKTRHIAKIIFILVAYSFGFCCRVNFTTF